MFTNCCMYSSIQETGKAPSNSREPAKGRLLVLGQSIMGFELEGSKTDIAMLVSITRMSLTV